jgi:ethanolamine utilization protein EutM
MAKGYALGMIEAIGITAAAAALDASLKAADVKCVGVEKVIGVDKMISVTINIVGEVAAVQAGVESGVEAAQKVGKVAAHHVMARPHEEIELLINQFYKHKL